MSNMGTVREIYEAFGRGDVPAILNKLDGNVEWETQNPVAGVPWLQSRPWESKHHRFFRIASTAKDHPL